MRTIKRLILVTLLLCMTSALAGAGEFVAGKGSFMLNGKPFVVKAAELHYPRIPRPYWDHRIKMCKALGMNTICIYVFWNLHEPREGQFNFEGNADVAEFCRLAQQNGMWVIVRPGPYVCAEWEMGGLPWWLLKKKDIELRHRDPYFMERVKAFETAVAGQLAPLTIANGGPVIMMQVENEYGSYGTDREYVGEIRDCLRGLYPGTTLFQCDWASNFENNGLDDLVWTMNFGTGSDITEQFRRLGQLRPDAPKMCSEFWSGWFDKWGARHETRPAADMVEGIDEMLSRGISFSLYMTHGGTSFGHWAGANSPGYAPDVTSYDYDAPIDESGRATEKYQLLRQTLQKYTPGKLPSVPGPAAPIVAVGKTTLHRVSTLDSAAQRTIDSRVPLCFEDMDLGHGVAIYTTTLPEVADSSLLTVDEAHDYVLVYVDDTLVGAIDRVRNGRVIALPPVHRGQQLKLVVEAMGRINFGHAIKDYKGITRSVSIDTEIDGNDVTINLKDWHIALLPDDYAHLASLTYSDNGNSGPGIYKGVLKVNKPGDTFINLERWGKGQLWVNGHALGRFWSIGPQQTLYCPGCWLRKGDNEIMVMDVEGPVQPVAWGQTTPELDKLQLKDNHLHNNPGDRPDLNSATPVATGTLGQSASWQTVSWGQARQGRYLAIEINGTHGGVDPAIDELRVLGVDGSPLPADRLKPLYADSENDLRGNHTLDKLLDLQESTRWSAIPGTPTPCLVVIDLGADSAMTGVSLLARDGGIASYRIFIY